MILAARRTMAWKNGGGVTHELWRSPPEPAEFTVRLSLAEVASSGPFSEFPGVDRVITLVAGAGFRLSGAGGSHEVSAVGAPFAFDGQLSWDCVLLGGPIRDFNVMVRRGSGLRARVAAVAGGALPANSHSVLALAPGVAVGAPGALAAVPPEALAILEAGDTELLAPPGAALVVILEPCSLR